MKIKGKKLVFLTTLIFSITLIIFLSNTISKYAGTSINNNTNEKYNNDNNKNLNSAGLIYNENLYYSYPKDAKILITDTKQYYKVIESTLFLDKPQGNVIRELSADEFLVIDSIDGEYGKFNTLNDNLTGYVNLGNLYITFDKPISFGVSRVDKAISNDNSYYVLAKGETVVIKDQEEGNITILDENDLEYVVDEASIDVRIDNESTSRNLISRRTKSLTKLISSAYGLIGRPYVYGDIGAKGFDCSGFIYSLYLKQLDIELPRSSNEQVNVGSKINKTDLVPGDLVFFNTTGRKISHVGLYIGEGNMIHASSGKGAVRIDSVLTGYYNDRYVTARRIVN